MVSTTRYKFSSWEIAAKDTCRDIGWWKTCINTLGSKACHSKKVSELKMSGVDVDSLPTFEDGEHLKNIKSIIDWYIDSKAWERDPALMSGVDGYNTRYSDTMLHSFLWRSIGAEAITYCEELGVRVDEDSISSTIIKKQKDYGPKNISRFGLNGLVIRTHDKLARVENLLSKPGGPQAAVHDESIYDTLLDIGGYAAIALMWINKDFLLPLGS